MVNLNKLLRLMEVYSLSGEEDVHWEKEKEEAYKRRKLRDYRYKFTNPTSCNSRKLNIEVRKDSKW